MPAELFYEDVEVGDAIPALTKHPTIVQSVKWACAIGDYARIHFDKDFAQSRGLSGVILNGWLTLSYLGQMITDWLPRNGTLVKLGCRFEAIVFPEEDVICRGNVTKKYVANGRRYIDIRIWSENPAGLTTVSGAAVVALSSKGIGEDRS